VTAPQRSRPTGTRGTAGLQRRRRRRPDPGRLASRLHLGQLQPGRLHAGRLVPGPQPVRLHQALLAPARVRRSNRSRRHRRRSRPRCRSRGFPRLRSPRIRSRGRAVRPRAALARRALRRPDRRSPVRARLCRGRGRRYRGQAQLARGPVDPRRPVSGLGPGQGPGQETTPLARRRPAWAPRRVPDLASPQRARPGLVRRGQPAGLARQTWPGAVGRDQAVRGPARATCRRGR
jgi:hypothetical protein